MTTCTMNACTAARTNLNHHRSTPARPAARPGRPPLPGEALGRAIALLDGGRPTEADAALTAALVDTPHDADLWLAAGVARLRRGAIGGAKAAFEMCAWISGDTLARELAGLL